jgi:riboflavin biosynthesis pyrimidine reductase
MLPPVSRAREHPRRGGGYCALVVTQESTDRGPRAPAPTLLRRLLPPGEAATAAEIVEGLGLWERPAGAHPGRPHVMLNMITSADGSATLGGRSGGLSGRADRELFHALRTPVDAVLVGAATVRAERYGRLIVQEHRRSLRRERGLCEEPLACIVSRSLELDPSIPLLAEPAARVLVITPSQDELPPVAADVRYVRTPGDGVLGLAHALAQLSAAHGVGTLLCEGGPHLARDLLAGSLLDEVFLSISPKLTGGDTEGGRALRILAGEELQPTVELELLGAHESESHLFLRYAVVAPERVSRETMASSSLAS